jgi:hypothetical protein
MKHAIDERRFGELLEESDDLQSDAMKTSQRDLGGYMHGTIVVK